MKNDQLSGQTSTTMDNKVQALEIIFFYHYVDLFELDFTT